jgi:predicted MFS family arabinose efflux permease
VRRVLRLPAYRRLLAAYSLNELGWSVGTLALAVLVYRHTGSAVGSAAFFLCSQFFPALLSPAVVSRIDQRAPRRVLPSLYALEAVLFGVLAWVASRFSLVPVLALATLDGIVAVAARALARAATVGVLTPVGLLREGNAVTNGLFSVCFMAGPALGGLVVVSGGTVAALLVNSGLFAGIALILVTGGALPAAPKQDTPAAGRLRAAIAHVRGDRVLRALLGVQTVALVFFTISTPVEVVLVQHSLHAGAGGYGAVLSSWGAGAVAGSAAYGRWRGLPARGLIAASAAALGVGFLVMAAAPSLLVAVIGAVVGGAGNGIESVAARTAVQEQTPERWMALVMSFTESLTQAAPGAGFVLGGVIAALAGPRIALGIAGAGSLVVTVTIWVVLRPRAGFHFLPAARAGSDAAHEGSGAASEGEPASFPSSERLV